MSFNITDSKEKYDPEFKIKDLFLDKEMSDRLKWNTIFQRKLVWTIKQKQELILSALSHRPLPPIHLNETSKQDYLIVDGLQRLDAVGSFINNDFSVHYQDPEQGIDLTFKYKDLTNSPKGEFMSKLKDQLLHYKLPICIWKFNDFNKIQELFKIYNGGTSLRSEELQYCNAYLVRSLISFIIANKEDKMSLIFKSDHLDMSRSQGHKNVHKLLISLFGPLFTEKEIDIVKTVNMKVIGMSCNQLTPKMENYFSDNKVEFISLAEEDIIDDKIISHLGMASNFKKLDKIFNIFIKVIENKNVYKQGFGILDFIHLASFLIEKERLGETSFSIYEDNIPKIIQLIDNFLIWKNESKEQIRRNGELRSEFRNKLILIWNELDFPKLNSKYITESEKQLAIAKSNGKDPFSGLNITHNNMQFDHKNPQSLGGKTEIALLTNQSNRKKSNLNNDFFKSGITYTKK